MAWENNRAYTMQEVEYKQNWKRTWTCKGIARNPEPPFIGYTDRARSRH